MKNDTFSQEEERVLMARIGRGDTVALELLYHRYRARLHRFLSALGCAAAELDALCNETFYIVWQKAAGFDGRSRTSTWIFGIARHKAIDLFRKERRSPTTSSPEQDVLDELPDRRIGLLEQTELHERLETALDALPGEQRLVVELAFRDGLSYEEIASVMDCPASTVKTRVFHARRKLRRHFPEFVDSQYWRHSR